jgi:hypothetical protein
VEVLGEAYEEGMGCPFADLRERADKWPECDPWNEGFFDDWYPRLTAADITKLNEMVSAWLKEEPDWVSEEDHFHYPANGQELAFEWLQEFVDNVTLDRLEIGFIEGLRPGDNTRAAQMSLGPEEANQICKDEGIPLHFERKLWI